MRRSVLPRKGPFASVVRTRRHGASPATVRHALRLFVALCLGAGLMLPSRVSAQPAKILLAGFPTLRQEHSLTCEASATSMATRAVVSEDDIMALLPRHPNPNIGYRGNPDGRQGTKLVDYGVYAAPVHHALQKLGYRSEVIMYGRIDEIASYLNKGWPVVTWISYALQRSKPRIAWYGGTHFYLAPHEHTVLVVGYDGASLIINDPWDGKRYRYALQPFWRSWGYFQRMALAVEPCALPSPVTKLKVSSATPTGIVFTWHAAAGASTYTVTLIRHGATDKVVKRAKVTGTSYTLTTFNPQTYYEIDVRPLSACNDGPAGASRWVLSPALPPTVTPSPIAQVTADAKATPVPTRTPKP